MLWIVEGFDVNISIWEDGRVSVSSVSSHGILVAVEHPRIVPATELTSVTVSASATTILLGSFLGGRIRFHHRIIAIGSLNGINFQLYSSTDTLGHELHLHHIRHRGIVRTVLLIFCEETISFPVLGSQLSLKSVNLRRTSWNKELDDGTSKCALYPCAYCMVPAKFVPKLMR